MLRRLLGMGASLLLAAAVYLVFMGHGTSVEMFGGSALQPSTQAPIQASGPGLAGGTGSLLPEPDAAASFAQVVRGTVVNEKAEPVRDIRIELCFESPYVSAVDPTSAIDWHRDATQRAVERVLAPKPLRVTAFVATGADGTFELTAPDRGTYLVRAVPTAPQFGTHARVTVSMQAPKEILLRTGPGHTLIGRIIDRSDKPIPAVLVLRSKTLASDLPKGNLWSGDPLSNDSDGGFTLEGLPPGSYLGHVIVPGRFRIRDIPVTLPREDPWIIRVPSGGGALKGTIKGAGGENIPAADLLVHVAVPEIPGAGFEAVARSSEDGSYEIAALPAGPITRLQVGAKGYINYESTVPLATWAGKAIPAKGTTEIDIVLMKGATVHGRVHTADDKPVAGVTVMVVPSKWRAPDQGSPGTLSVSTDEEGLFRIEGVPVGKHVLFAVHAEYYIPSIEDVANQAGPPSELLVLVDESAKTIERNITIAKGISISGVVLSTDDEPIEDAEVRTKEGLQDRWFGSWGVSTHLGALHSLARTASDGTFTVQGLAPRSDWILAARADGRLGQWSEPISNEKELAEPVTLRMETGVAIRGTVIDDDGPVANADVSYWARSSKFLRNQSTVQSKSDGTFEINGVPPGDAGVSASDRDGRRGHTQIKGIEADEDKEDIEVKLDSRGVELSGILLDEDSKPLPNYRIQASGSGPDPYGTTDAEGKFHFGAGPKGQIRFRVNQPGTNSWQWTVGKHHSPSDDIEVTFKPKEQRIVQGRVLGPDGNPVPLLFVHAAIGKVPKENDWRYHRGTNTEVVGGSFRLVVVGEGDIWIRVQSPRDSEGKPMNARGTAKQLEKDEWSHVELTLEPGLTVTGIVRGPESETVSGALVQAGRLMARTGDDGRFTLQGLKEGNVVLSVRPPPEYSAPPAKSVKAGAEDVELLLLASAVLRGRVTDADNIGVSGGRVNVQWKDPADGKQQRRSARMDGEGRFVVKGIPAGQRVDVNVSLWGRGNRGRVAEPKKGVDPSAGELILIAERGALITGYVVDQYGDPVQRIRINAHPAEQGSGRRSSSANTNQNGEFTLRSLNEGEYRISAQAHNGLLSVPPFYVQAPSDGVRIKLPPSTEIRGRINDPAGGQGWRVTIQRPNLGGAHSFNVKSDGTWIAPRVELDATYIVRAHNQNANLYAVDENVSAGTTNVVLEPQNGLRISGRVETHDGAAVQGWIQCNGPGWQISRKTDIDGNFQVGPFPPGQYSMWVYQYNVWDNRIQVHNVSAGQSSVIVQLPK